MYLCVQTQGGVDSHRRAKYFGGYKWKNVKFIHEIKAVVVIEKNYENEYVQWNNSNCLESELIQEAKDKILLWDYRKEEIQNNGIQVFLLENPNEVNFKKTSKGGLYGNKKYFRDFAKKLNATTSYELASEIVKRNLSWK